MRIPAQRIKRTRPVQTENYLRSILERSRQQYREEKWLREEEFWSRMKETEPVKQPVKQGKKKA